MSKVNKKNIKREGFTLVELLAVIVIIAVIAGIATYTVINTVNKSKESGNRLTVDSIYKSAGLYITENNFNDNYWGHEDGDEYDSMCVSISELVNQGYLKKKSIKDIKYDHVMVVRNYSSKSITGVQFADNNVCVSGGWIGELKAPTLKMVYVTTSSVKIHATCSDSDKVINYVFTAMLDNKVIKTINQNNSDVVFSNLSNEDNKEYSFISKCEYSGNVSTKDSDSLRISMGKSSINFEYKGLISNSANYYKEYNINYNSDGIHTIGSDGTIINNSVKYFRIKGTAILGNNTEVYKCGNDNSPSNCDNTKATSIENGYWYKVNGNSADFKIISNSTVYARVWDGEKYSSNKSTQVTFPTNPRIIWSIEHDGLEKMSGGAIGSEVSIDGVSGIKKVVDYHTDRWLRYPVIKWYIADSSNAQSNFYYSDGSYTKRSIELNTNNKLSPYWLDGWYSISNDDNINTNDYNNNVYGMQRLTIVAINKNGNTEDKTIVPIDVNIDRSEPIAEINTTKTLKSDNQTVTPICSDDNSGVSEYYFGKTNPANNNVTYSKWNESIKNTGIKITADGTYYLSCKDSVGNQKTTSITYYKYTVNNMLQNVSGSGYTTSNYTRISNASYIAPKDTNLTLANIYTIPDGSSASRFVGISSGAASTTAATVNKTVPKLTGNAIYTLWFNRNIVYFKYKTNGGTLTNKTTASDGTVYTWSTNNNGYISRTLNGNNTDNLSSYRYGTNNVDLLDYNNSKYLEIIKSGQAAKSGSEWICESGCITANKTFTDAGLNNYHTDNICNAKNGDCTVVVKVNWTEKPVRIYYNTNGGTINGSGYTHYVSNGSKTNWVGTSASEYLVQTFNGDTVNNLYYVNGSINITKSGYSPKSGAQWCARKEDGSNIKCIDQTVSQYKYSDIKALKMAEYSEYYKVWLYANWADVTAPAVTISVTGAKTGSVSKTGGTATFNYNDLNWTNKTPKFTVSISDVSTTTTNVYYNPAEVYTSRGAYSTSNVLSAWKNTNNKSGTFEMTSGGMRQVALVSKDASGNTTTIVINANLDYTKPSLKVNLSGAASTSDTNNSGTKTVNYNSGNWTNVKPTVAFTITDSTSTKMSIYYNSISYTSRPAYSTSNYVNKYNGTTKIGPYNELSDTSGSLQIGSGGQRQIAIYVIDAAGNSVTTVINANLDFDSPTCTAIKPVTGWSASGKTVDVTCSDSGSGCASGAGEFTAYKDTTYTVKDKAGNSGTCSASVTAQYWYARRTRSSYCNTCSSAGCASYTGWSVYSTEKVGTCVGQTTGYVGNYWYYECAWDSSTGYAYVRTWSRSCSSYNSSCSSCGTSYGSWSSWSGYDYSSGCDSYTCESTGKWYYY